MISSRTLGLFLLTPALTIIVMLFLIPVVLTGVFAFTNMSTATGISGGAYQISPAMLQELRGRHDMSDLAERISEPKYVIDEAGLTALGKAGVGAGILADLQG